MKKILPLLVVGILVLSGLGAVAITSNKATIEKKLPIELIIDGPSYGNVGEQLCYILILNDPEGCEIWFYIDWDDGTNPDWIGPYMTGDEALVSHTWYECGIYNFSVQVEGCDGTMYSETFEVTIIDNHPPSAPEITGSTGVPPGTYEYTFKAIDPDEDDVKYFIEWGDDNTEETDFHASDEKVKLNHTFLEIQVYLIRAKAIDIHGMESEWGYMNVEISKNSQQVSNNPSSQNTMSVIPSTGNVVFNDDTTPPVTNISLNGTMSEHGIFTSDVEVTLNATDDLSGVNVTYYNLDIGGHEIYNEPFMVTGHGRHVLAYWSVDNAGNKEKTQFIYIQIDFIPPEIDLLWYILDNKSIKFDPYVWDSGSGIYKVEYYIDNKYMHTAYGANSKWIWTPNITGRHLVSGIAYDKAGYSTRSDKYIDIPRSSEKTHLYNLISHINTDFISNYKTRC